MAVAQSSSNFISLSQGKLLKDMARDAGADVETPHQVSAEALSSKNQVLERTLLDSSLAVARTS